MSILVIDVGTTSIRAGLVTPEGEVRHLQQKRLTSSIPAPGMLELDAEALARDAVELAISVLQRAGSVAAVGITNQRSTTVVWDRATGKLVAPAIGWQDLRTVFRCVELAGMGYHVPPNASATKIEAIMDSVDPERTRDLCFGTVDSWMALKLSGGAVHVTDPSNAAMTALLRDDGTSWNEELLSVLRIPERCLPQVVDTSGVAGIASILPGHPPVTAMVGDQQASMAGQGCTLAGSAKITFGTGAMLDCCTGDMHPQFSYMGPVGGTIPIIAWQRNAALTWGVEALMLAAGASVTWLVDDLSIIDSPEESASVAASCADTEDVYFVPALMGLGTPVWDFGARGAFFGITGGTTRAQLVRAVLEGIAHRGVDLIDAAERDTGLTIPTVRVDGGMSTNEIFVQMLADLSGRPVEVSRVTEATTLGAGLLAGMAVGIWRDTGDLAKLYRPAKVVEPRYSDDERTLRRSRFLAARDRACRTVPELSDLHF
ncbi:MAG: FGGY-family carbohydrate kinase [Actinobacteria bacterium]|nr:FGGY-family carbohydrate kinase [Actinomycetota bacterium]